MHFRYAGWLEEKKGIEGRLLDSNTDPDVAGMEFVAGTGMVIAGIDEGVMGMKIGGRRRLVIPSRMAYGNLGVPADNIPRQATCIFEVLVESIRTMASNLIYTIRSETQSTSSSFK